MVTVIEVDLPRNRISLSMRSRPELRPAGGGAVPSPRTSPGQRNPNGPRPSGSGPRAPQTLNNDWFSAALNKKR